MKHARKKIGFMVLWITLSIFVGVLAAAYGYTVYYFSSRFSYNTLIDGVDCKYMSVVEVEEVIGDRIDNYEILVIGRDGLRKIISAEDVGLHYVSDGQVEALFEQQNPFLWFMPLIREPMVAQTGASVKYNSYMLKMTIDALGLYNETGMRLPADAFIEFQDSQYVIHPEDKGSTLIPDRTEEVLLDAFTALSTEIDLDAAGCYLDPTIFSDDPSLIETVNTWNRYARFLVIYEFGDYTEVLDPTITLGWIDIAEDGTGTLNEWALRAWLREFGYRHDTIGTARTFKTATGEVVTVEGGDYGWEVDEAAEFDAILTAYWYCIGEKREPIYVRRADAFAKQGEPDWGTTYIELDLTNQHMYYFVDGKSEFEADVVTGSPWGGRETPPGIYWIKEMSSPAKLVGAIQADGRPEYETYVSYWMRMTWAGHGFHDATWQPWFGGDRYTYAGSHGCINMSYYDAEALYYMIEEGTPVISHY